MALLNARTRVDYCSEPRDNSRETPRWTAYDAKYFNVKSLEDCWQQDHYGCNQGGSDKSGKSARKKSSSVV